MRRRSTEPIRSPSPTPSPRKRALLLAGEGPALLDVECYRSAGHSTTDANAYRTKDEIERWSAYDPIASFGRALIGAGVVTSAAIEAMQAEVARDDAARHPGRGGPDDRPDRRREGGARPHRAADVFERGDPGSIRARSDASPIPPRTRGSFRTRRKAASACRSPARRLSTMRAITVRDGLFEAILHHMLNDERLIAYGEECRDWGGAFGVYRGLADLLPYHRLFNAPISEAAIVATAVGYALEGGRALIELMYADFIGRAGDEIFNQMAKWQAMSAGALKVPVVLRCSVGSKYGAQHSQDWTALVAHIPGLKVFYPATPFDAKGLMATALSSEDPVVFFESQRLYDTPELFHAGGVPKDYYRIPAGEPDVKRAGEHVTILTIGPSLYPAMDAAAELEQAYGVTAEIIDARCLVPFNYDPVLESVRKTGRLVIVTEACERGSFAMTLSANVARFGFGDLKAPPRVIGSPNWIVPGADMEFDLLSPGARHRRYCRRGAVPGPQQEQARREDLERPRPRPTGSVTESAGEDERDGRQHSDAATRQRDRGSADRRLAQEARRRDREERADRRDHDAEGHLRDRSAGGGNPEGDPGGGGRDRACRRRSRRHRDPVSASAPTIPAVFHAAGQDGPAILLIHGFGADRLSWLVNQQALAAAGRVFALDLPGHGETPLTGPGRLGRPRPRRGEGDRRFGASARFTSSPIPSAAPSRSRSPPPGRISCARSP